MVWESIVHLPPPSNRSWENTALDTYSLKYSRTSECETCSRGLSTPFIFAGWGISSPIFCQRGRGGIITASLVAGCVYVSRLYCSLQSHNALYPSVANYVKPSPFADHEYVSVYILLMDNTDILSFVLHTSCRKEREGGKMSWGEEILLKSGGGYKWNLQSLIMYFPRLFTHWPHCNMFDGRRFYFSSQRLITDQ